MASFFILFSGISYLTDSLRYCLPSFSSSRVHFLTLARAAFVPLTAFSASALKASQRALIFSTSSFMLAFVLNCLTNILQFIRIVNLGYSVSCLPPLTGSMKFLRKLSNVIWVFSPASEAHF